MKRLSQYPDRNELRAALERGVSVEAVTKAVNRNNERAALANAAETAEWTWDAPASYDVDETGESLRNGVNPWFK